ncbi:MAG: hypothetical protein K0M63_00280 [Weeksellaceae bacterium]|nr:hypothetical protein [Weeksellaceae bacterium]
MKKILLLSSLLLFSCSLLSQYSDKTDYIAEFSMEDGSTLKGHYFGEITHSSSVGAFVVSNRIASFQYTPLGEDKRKKLSARDVKKIVYYNGDDVAKIQEKIQVKTVIKNGKLSSDTDEEFEYLLYDGKIKLYGSNVFFCENMGCYYTHTNFYIKKDADPYAVLAVKPKGQMSFKLGSSIENTVDAFRAVGGKCPAFNDYLNFFDKTMIKEQQLDKKLQKDYQEIFKETMRELAAKKASRRLFDEVAGRIQSHQMEVFVGIIGEYEKACP